MISQRSMAHAPQAALVDSIIGCRRGFLHALGARAERDEYVLCVPIEALLRACLWHLPRCCGDRCVCTLVCLQGLQLPSRSYSKGIESLMNACWCPWGPSGCGQRKGILRENSL